MMRRFLPALCSLVAFLATAQAAPSSPPSSSSSNGKRDSSSSDSVAGAEGPDSGSFKISKGGMIAIIVVAVVVAVGGVVSAALYFLAKKRQWTVRKSLKRVSRRITGRGTGVQSNQRSAMRMQPPPAARPRGNDRDLEKGNARPGGNAGRKPMPSAQTPVVKSWKDQVFGYKA